MACESACCSKKSQVSVADKMVFKLWFAISSVLGGKHPSGLVSLPVKCA